MNKLPYVLYGVSWGLLFAGHSGIRPNRGMCYALGVLAIVIDYLCN